MLTRYSPPILVGILIKRGDPESFLKGVYAYRMSKVYVQLRSTFAKWISESESESFTLILLFDEARPLCEISAYDGLPLINNTYFDSNGARIESKIETEYAFTNFRAVKQALRLLLFSSRTEDEPYPRLFGLFTDTSSHLSDFEPHSAMSRSARMYSEFDSGIKQFPSVFAFTSLDVYARIYCRSPCLSDPEAVSDPERLIKFGRAGWYSMYLGKNENNIRFYDLRTLAGVAGTKLLNLPGVSHLELEQRMKTVGTRLPDDLSLRLLALLAVRLDITAGAFTTEAGELVANHLGVLIDADNEHSFLKIRYPSEPILAAVSAFHLRVIGWGSSIDGTLQLYRFISCRCWISRRAFDEDYLFACYG